MQNRRRLAKGGAIRRSLIAIAVLGFVASGSAVLAQQDAAPTPVAAPADTATEAPAPVADAPADTPKADEQPEEGSNADLLAKLKEAKEEYDKLRAAQKDENQPTKFAWAGLIAALAALLIAGIKRAMKLTGKAKKVLPWVAVGLGGIGVVAAKFAVGVSLFDAILYGGAATLSVVLHELGLIPIPSVDKAEE